MSKSKSASQRKPPSSTAMGRMEIMMEDMSSKMTLLTESVAGSLDGFRAEMREMRAELFARIEILESVVRQNSADIRVLSDAVRKNSEDIRKNSEDIRKNSEDIEWLRSEIVSLRNDLSSLRLEVADVRAEVRAGVAEMRAEVRALATRTELEQLSLRVSKVESLLIP